ncbi:alpha-galactosidase [Lactiplantibacillus daowaiensis]|uniref:Alpha-galactosidase n=1 Tax=Lactiplantibacillus daowaiensis TaxID=2559918 RepID=A0ABW1S0L5_9LACO|nr:alpha-galactosidase [Lactiplantibacillus daowaiensis]
MTTPALIHFDPESQVFHLTNGRISYLLAIETGGYVGQLYFGQAIQHYHGQLKYPHRDRGFSGNLPGSLDRAYSLDTLAREYSSQGDGDFRTPALVVQQADGSQAARLIYQDYQLTPGKPKLAGLPAAYVVEPDEAQTLTVRLKDPVSELVVALRYTIYRDYDIVARSVNISNAGSTTVQLAKVASMQLDFATQDFEVISLPGGHVNERHLQREKVGYGVKNFSSRRGTSSHQMNPFIALCTPTTDENQGEVYGFNLVYSGNHLESVEKDQFDQTRVTIGINPDQFNWRLTPGDSFQAPEVLMAYSATGLNGMSQAYHHLLRERVARGKHQFAERPIVVNNWEATFWHFNADQLKPIVAEAKHLGIEMFVLDDGWFGHRDDDNSSLGDWQVMASKFPDGLSGFANYVHQQGLKFGMWFEPEMISFDSDLYQAHPDYLLQVPGRAPSPARNQYVLDMGRAEVRQNVHDQLAALLKTGQIDYIKWDMNRNLTDLYSPALPADQQGEVSHRYVLGVYALLEALTSEFPDVLWEGCSGGGGRFDAGWLYYMPQSWTSDNTDAVARMTIQYGTSLAYPISATTAHVSVAPNQQTGRPTSLTTRGDVAMSGVFGYELDLTELTAAEKTVVQQQVTTYQALRPLIQFGDFYRLLDPSKGNRCAWEFVQPDQSEVVAFSFNILNVAQPPLRRLRLIGLNPDWQYQEVTTGAIYGGDELMRTGFYEPFATEDFTSQRYHFKALSSKA